MKMTQLERDRVRQRETGRERERETERRKGRCNNERGWVRVKRKNLSGEFTLQMNNTKIKKRMSARQGERKYTEHLL